MQHHRWDEVEYHGHPCVVETEWDEGTSEHWLVLRPTDLEDGVYVITEDQLEVDQQDHVYKGAA